MVALIAAIESREVRALPPHLGAVWQFADSTEVLSDPSTWERLASVYSD